MASAGLPPTQGVAPRIGNMTVNAAIRLRSSLTSWKVWGALIVMVVLGVSLALRLQMIEGFPLWYDEGYYLNLATNWSGSGELSFRMWRVPAESHLIAGGGVGYGALLLVEWLRVFGVTVASGRILMLLCSLVALGALFAAVREWQGVAAAAAAVAYASVSGPYMGLIFVRMDAAAVMGYTVVFWLFALARRRGRPLLHVLVGLLAVLVAELHVVGFVFAFALSFLYAVDYLGAGMRQRRLVVRRHAAWSFALGAGIASACYLALHVLPDPKEFFLMATRCVICAPRGLHQEWTRVVEFTLSHRIDAVIMAVSLLVLGWLAAMRRRPEDVRVLLLVVGVALGLAVFNPPAKWTYLNHLLPVLALVVGSAFAGLFELSGRGRVLLVLAGLLALMLLCDHALYVMNTTDRRWDLADDCPQLVAIRECAPPDTVVMSTPPYFAHLTEYSQFLAEDRHGRLVVEALYGVPYGDFLDVVRPQVYLGELWTPRGRDESEYDPREGSTRSYMERHRFRQIMPRLWVDGEQLRSGSGSCWSRYAPDPAVLSSGFEEGDLGDWQSAEE